MSWTQRVTRESNALDLEPGVFTWIDPTKIAKSLKRSADKSRRKKSSSFRSAMSMLCFYMNRAGTNLSPERIAILNEAKNKLRGLYSKS